MKYNYIKTLVTCFIAVAVFASSCQKENGVDNLGGEATVTINMQGVGPSTGNNAKAGLRASASAGNTIATPAVQRQVVKFNDQFNVTATLKEVTPTAAPALRASANRAETTATGEGDILPLANGTEYTVVISQGDDEVFRETFTAGEGEHTFNIEAGNYTYVAYAYGDVSASGADQDPLWVSGSLNATAGANTLPIVLEHKLTEVTVVFNAGTGRTINTIGAGTLAPNHTYTFDEETGVVSFGTETEAAGISFPSEGAAQAWTSNPAMIAVEDTENGVVELPNVTINDIPGSITSGGWALRAGVQYTLELNLGDNEDEGIDVGGSMWSSGNLTYNPDTEEYYFGESHNATGDYWFPNRLLPKRLDGTNQGADGTNGGTGDPCALVSSSWRLPTEAELQDLVDRTASGGADNPGPNPWSAPARYVDYYDGTTDTDLGMFFGVLTDPVAHPGEDRDQYLFFPYGGYYPNDNIGETVGQEAAYLTSATAGGYRTFHLTGDPGNIGWGTGWRDATDSEAVQIRCVQD